MRAHKHVLLPQEDAAAFAALEATILADLAPEGALQTVLPHRMETDQSLAAISVIDPADWSRRVFAHGLRNPLGFDWHPETGQLWAADHGSVGSATRCRPTS